MKNLLGSFVIAFSMYSRIPMVQVNWTKERMKYALCFFPLIGAVIGFCTAGSLIILERMNFYVLSVMAAAVMPLLLTGGIHMDGFLDVTDARASHMDRDRKLEIMKDPHTGAFAVIYAVVYMILMMGAISELNLKFLVPFGLIYVISRALSGLAVVTFPMAKTSGLAAAFSSQAHKQVVAVVMILYLIISLCLMFWTGGIMAGTMTVFLCLCVFGYYHYMSVREFGGITGDLAGYFLQIMELCLIFGLAVVPHIGE